jgi:hypothetical protein
MSEVPSLDPDRGPDTLPEALRGRFASVVHILRGRRSPLSGLGVLELNRGQLSLHDRAGTQLFAVPTADVHARPARRRSFETHRSAFEVEADGRWWFLQAHAPTKYERASTRALAERYDAREVAPRPVGMSADAFADITQNPLKHQLLWRLCWLEALNSTAHA